MKQNPNSITNSAATKQLKPFPPMLGFLLHAPTTGLHIKIMPS